MHKQINYNLNFEMFLFVKIKAYIHEEMLHFHIQEEYTSSCHQCVLLSSIHISFLGESQTIIFISIIIEIGLIIILRKSLFYFFFHYFNNWIVFLACMYPEKCKGDNLLYVTTILFFYKLQNRSGINHNNTKM
jgi:hypothetical protein